jgi:hypothetical protein
MKAKLLFCLALVLSGAIFNVLVAWGCVLWSPYNRFVSPPEKVDNTMPANIVGPDYSLGWWRTSTGVGVFESEPWVARVYYETHFDSWRSKQTPAYFRCGWPMLSMQSLVTHYEASDGHYLAGEELPRTEIIHRGFQTSKLPAWLHAQEERRLPIVPLWFGFVCNTAIYFFILTALWFTSKRIRKRNFISAPA